MNIIFFGSSKYSTIVANALHKEFGLKLIVTIPDKPLGRNKIRTPSPVKEFAMQYGIPVLTFDELDTSAIENIKSMTNTPDFLVVDDYRLILPPQLIILPAFAALNVHHSLLPKYRGPSPAPAAILAGEKATGVTIMKMNEGVDTGHILAQEKYIMQGNETTQSLLTNLNTLGANILIPVVKNYQSIMPQKQDESQTTCTKRYTKEDAFIDSKNPPNPEQLDRMIRAFYPWPGVWTRLPRKASLRGVAGRPNELRIKLLPEKKIQPEGKKPMTIKDFLNGYPASKQLLERLLGEQFLSE